jgi:hypothetical protein
VTPRIRGSARRTCDGNSDLFFVESPEVRLAVVDSSQFL